MLDNAGSVSLEQVSRFSPRASATAGLCAPRRCEGSAAELVLTAAREELARLVEIIGELACHPVLRSPDEGEIALTGSSAAVENSDVVLLTAPIHDAVGKVSASLELTVEASTSQILLRSLLRTTTRAISERLFRLHFSKHWVIAGRHPQRQKNFILLALDSQQNLVGADHNARELLRHGRPSETGLPSLASLFPLGIPRLSHRRTDSVLTLNSVADGAPWTLLITPPCLAPQQTPPSAEALQHSRPRLDAFCQWPSSNSRDESQPLPSRLVRRIEEYVDANLDAALCNSDLALRVGISAAYFARSFRKTVGMTPHSFVMQRRLLHAQKLLLSTNCSLAEIALLTGFSDQSHFSRRFHQSVGMPPRAFRQLHV